MDFQKRIKLNNRVSVYTRRSKNDPNYYRSYQYFDKIDNIEIKYCKTQSESKSSKTASERNVFYKIYLYIIQCFRSLYYLICDLNNPPKYIVVIREFVTRRYPYIHKIILKKLFKKGVIFYWDFDDNILEGKNITRKDFIFFSKLCSRICVTHQFLADLVLPEYKSKILLVPTTDGDIYKLFSHELIRIKGAEIKSTVRIVWVGTHVNLLYLENIIKYLDEAAKILKRIEDRKLILQVICNQPLKYITSFLEIQNISWSRDKAIEGIQSAHIGIMPLSDNLYTRGKGGFKLIQYLSIGVPGLATNVGFNTSILNTNAKCGRLINEKHPEEWVGAIREISNPNKWPSYAYNAYEYWCTHFSYESNLALWRTLFGLN